MQRRYSTQDLLAELKAEIESMERTGEKGAQSMRTNVREMTDRAKTKASDMADRAKVAGKQADRYVHDHPWRVVLGAAAAGAALGYMAKKRRQG